LSFKSKTNVELLVEIQHGKHHEDFIVMILH